MDNSFYMRIARSVAQMSPDTGRKTSCVLVEPGGNILALACNRFPDGVQSTPDRLQRPAKYIYIEHAERIAICSAARHGVALKGSTAYLPWFPCSDCARCMVQAGIAKMIAVEPDWDDERYNFRDSLAILNEGGVEIEYTTE